MNLTFTKATAMFRTPAKKTASSPISGSSPQSAERAGTSQPSARRSSEELEAGKIEPKAKSPANPKPGVSPPVAQKIPRSLETRRASADALVPSNKAESKYPNRTAEARACLSKAKLHLGNSRNLKTEIKTEVLAAITRLYEIVKESENSRPSVTATSVPTVNQTSLPSPNEETRVNMDLRKQLEENSALLKENLRKMESLQDEPAELTKCLVEGLKDHKQALQECQQHTRALSEHLQQAPHYVAGQGPTFAEIAAGPKQNIREPLHSVVVSSVNDQDTGEEVLEKLRTAVDARNEGTRVERLRKARDQKVVVGFKTREEMAKVTERIRKTGNLVVEEVKNKNPLVIIRDVLSCHSDAEMTQALQRQNTHLIGDIPADDVRLEVKYRRKTRNPHTCHVILQVSPIVWQRLTAAGRVHIDLQRVRVEDQTPLVQCTRCLGYGHGKRFCKEPADLCSHCGGPHLRVDCPDTRIGEAAVCVNCTRAKIPNHEHNAFSSECPVRRKWDALVRASVAYC